MASIIELTAFHPCDRCQQRSKEAWHRESDGALFTFCGHHSRQYEVELARIGFKLFMVARSEGAPA